MDESLYNNVIINIAEKLPKFFQTHKESVSFSVAYLGQIVIQHYLHAVLVFGRNTINTREKYLKTLGTTYATLSGILVGSTICNAILLKSGVPKRIAFWATLYGFGLISFLILKLASMSNQQGGEKLKSVSSVKETKKMVRNQTVVGRTRGGAESVLVRSPFISIFGRDDGDIRSMFIDRRNWGELLNDAKWSTNLS